MSFMVVVSAIEHPECDSWVMDKAVEQAESDGFLLGKYMGLIDERDTTGTYCHAFVAHFDWDREWNA